ncbi:MAG: hypothetical protein AB1600_08095, partial [Bacteroidota bacterium]
EVGDSASANLILKYNYSGVGQGQDLIYDQDTQGPYLRQWTINLRGPPTQPVLSAQYVSYVVAHEFEHSIYTTGNHSANISDLIYGNPIFRYNSGERKYESEKERKVNVIIYTLERNPKLLDYFK